MFRLTHHLRTLTDPTPARRRGEGTVRPVVIWNVTRRCNLRCRHCYSISADIEFPGELTGPQAEAVVDDLAAFRIPALILSGGEPLARRDCLSLARRAKGHGLYTALSTNGTPVVGAVADEVADIGFDYVGISLDGTGAVNDRFRGRVGAYDMALAGVRACVRRDVRVGLRFTLTDDNRDELPKLLALARAEGVRKFYLSHLVYAGRGDKNRADDAGHAATRAAVGLLIETAWEAIRAGEDFEIVTGNNDADAVLLLDWAAARFPAEAVAHLRAHLAAWGGNSAGLGVANIDPTGRVHPDTYWSDYTVGSVKERPFSEIWTGDDPMLAALRRRPRPLKGRCGACVHRDVCGGNTRIRALQLTGDPWAEDPACPLTDAEIGVADGAPRLTVAPFKGKSHDPAHRFH
jgi:heme d1 biosynthesis radical SAM protein NirJ